MAYTACSEVASAYTPAVQDVLAKLITSPEFKSLVTPTNQAIQQNPAASDSQANTAATKSGASTNDPMAQKLRELQSLRNDGVITEEEFQAKKKQLLENF